MIYSIVSFTFSLELSAYSAQMLTSGETVGNGQALINLANKYTPKHDPILEN